ncbi:histidine kinase [Desulfosporosinus sp. HMP52]|uniref:Spo0B domain-containing protein n=1 Tax=Desulfosporosinus sp. HMP52 TaxID=1487923 RepID=UPI00051FD076|nr:Spo0B domain-containing protein [Desulfosporosinus sp. HMP52]KGK91360.1 histidine kinase [Desulfosporosinus sp. HMP52]
MREERKTMTMSEVEQVLLSEMLYWYRLQRHDFLNHWQVIMGNLQLNRPSEALTYMQQSVPISPEEQKIAQITEPSVGAILLGFIIRLEQAKVDTTIDFPSEMKEKDFWKDHWREEYAGGLYGYTTECMANVIQSSGVKGLTAEIYLFDEPRGLTCQFMLSDEETILCDKVITLG